MGFLKTAPMRYLLLVTGAWLVIFLLTRSVLLITHLEAFELICLGIQVFLGFMHVAKQHVLEFTVLIDWLQIPCWRV